MGSWVHHTKIYYHHDLNSMESTSVFIQIQLSDRYKLLHMAAVVVCAEIGGDLMAND